MHWTDHAVFWHVYPLGFTSRPYPAVSVASIAAVAGVSEALVHKYF